MWDKEMNSTHKRYSADSMRLENSFVLKKDERRGVISECYFWWIFIMWRSKALETKFLFIAPCKQMLLPDWSLLLRSHFQALELKMLIAWQTMAAELFVFHCVAVKLSLSCWGRQTTWHPGFAISQTQAIREQVKVISLQSKGSDGNK